MVKAGNPGIEFRYSWVYDQEHKLRFTDPLYPDGDEIRKYIDGVKGKWRPRQRRVLSAISRISGLAWREDSIVCYVVGRGVPMSDPMTIPIYPERTDLFISKLVYCLVERMLMNNANLDAKRRFWENMFRSLSEDGVKVSYLVPVNAIYKELFRKHFRTGQTSEEGLLTRNLDYRRSWEIVNSIGPESIIESFRRGRWE
jgi:hypothetical protein